MKPLQFAASRIVPDEDVTERGLHRAIELSKDFDQAIADATTAARARQIVERLRACREWLTESENKALRKMDLLD